MSSSSQAERFLNAFWVLKENEDAVQAQMHALAIEHNKNLRPGQTPASAIGHAGMRHTMGVEIVCLAFAVELYIKELFFLSEIPVPQKHHIRHLFDMLPQDVRQQVYDIHTAGKYGWTLEAFRKLLDSISTGFEDFRYLYETNSAEYYSRFAIELIETLKKVIRSMWDKAQSR